MICDFCVSELLRFTLSASKKQVTSVVPMRATRTQLAWAHLVGEKDGVAATTRVAGPRFRTTLLSTLPWALATLFLFGLVFVRWF